MSKLFMAKRLAGVAAVAAIVSGCASNEPAQEWDTKRVLCVAAGSLAGIALDAAANTSDSDGKSKAAGALIGAGVGALICQGREAADTDKDGVVDQKDHCPNTPFGDVVDARGCSLDSDQDGVTDSRDQCPGTPLGTPVNSKGCALDSDRDGVIDSLDQCPGTPIGTQVDEVGCALASDSDGDGVNDDIDQCPNTPPGAVVNALGCENDAITLDGVNFEYKSADLTANSRTILDAAAQRLIKADVTVLVAGHTDSKGSDRYNLELSDRRANSVRSYLISQGVPANKITAQGFGEAQPVQSNATDAGRAANRRVEFQLQN